MSVTQKPGKPDRDVLRRLAGAIAVLAHEPRRQETAALWKALNDLRPQRPMLWITEIPWGEFQDDVDELRTVCADPVCREIETNFRRQLFVARHLPCDQVVEDVWRVPKVIELGDFGLPVKEHKITQGASPIQSHAYQPVIRDEGDLEKIRMPAIRHNVAATESRTAFAENLFGDILKVKTVGVPQHFFNGWDTVVRWTGVTEALLALVDRPEFIHALMRRYTDAVLARMDQLAQKALLDHYPLARVGSGGAGYTDELPQPDADPAHIRPVDQWGGATPQIFSDVSPAMHREFALRYEMEIMSRCGLNYYGCCEPLHNKMEILADVPRLRKVSISPWCDVAAAAARARRTYVFSHKPSPAVFADDRFDPARAAKDLRDRIERSGPMPCEFIMKDISTVRGDVKRLMEWCRTAWRVVTSS